MNESSGESLFHTIAAGDVYAFNTPVMAMVLLVMSKDEESHGEQGAKVYFRWLAHFEQEKVTACDWIYESSLCLMSVWQKVASAR